MPSYSIQSNGPSRPLMVLFGARHGRVAVERDVIEVRFGIMFRATIDRSAVADVVINDAHPVSRGAHGWRGRWLVNGSGRDLVDITVEPAGRGWVCGWPVKVRVLTVNVDDRDALVAELSPVP